MAADPERPVPVTRIRIAARGCPAAMWLLLFLFFLRVLGQVLVAVLGVPFLPPMEDWYSGLIPYPVLLPLQLAILALMIRVSSDVSREAGFFAVPRPKLGRVVIGLAAVYFAAMAARYAVTMALHPERRWLGRGTIPIVFHWVLAAWLFAFGRYHVRHRP